MLAKFCNVANVENKFHRRLSHALAFSGRVEQDRATTIRRHKLDDAISRLCSYLEAKVGGIEIRDSINILHIKDNLAQQGVYPQMLSATAFTRIR